MNRQSFMIKRLPLLILILSLNVLISRAQELPLNDFTTLHSDGVMPNDFVKFAKRCNVDYATQKNNTKKHHKARGKEKFEIASDFGMSAMLLSGRVVYGDVIGAYVNQVADSLLAPYPEIRSKLRFYITKSEVANAYSTDEGVIFINAGLIARVKNEAQLAYILAHEVVHYVKQHNIHIFFEKEKIYSRKRKDSEYFNLSVAERLLAINFRSKEIETEADLDALRNYFAHSSYDLQEAEDVFDVLLYSSYPFTTAPFDLSLIETKEMIIPDHYLVPEVENIRVSDDEADSLSTHPSVKIRRSKIKVLMDSITEYGSMKFLQSEARFKYINTLARFEVIRELINDHRLVEALYCTSSLLDELPDNKFLKKCFAAALYGISAYKTHGEADDYFTNYRNVKGEMRQVNYLIDKMSRRDFNILALGYVYRRHAENPDDAYLATITKELFKDLVFVNEVKDGFFYSKSLADLRAEQQKPEAVDTIANDAKQRRKKHTRSAKIDTTFTKFAFVDLMQNAQFVIDMNEFYDKKDSADKAREARNNTYSPFPVVSQEGVKKKKDRKYIHRFLMADPYTVQQDNRKPDNVLYQESELNQARVKELMVKNAQLAHLDMEMIDAKGMDSTSTTEFNEMAYVNEYIEERFHQNGEGIVVSFCKENIEPLMTRGNSHYLGWSAIITIQKKKPIVVLSLLSILPYMWPYTIYEFVVPKIHTYYYYVLFDVNTGRLKVGSASKIRSGLRSDKLNSHIYDFMYSVKKSYE